MTPSQYPTPVSSPPVSSIPADAPAVEPTARRHFPSGFRWGTATSSYQIEGAHDVDGKSESIWDRFCARRGAIVDASDGTVACDHYHRFDDDVSLMAELGLSVYRFSISWPRIIPGGTGKVNPAGLDFYDRLVDRLLEAGIEPHPTLYHWDLPQVLEDRGGWPVRATAEAFGDSAGVVAERLGDRVKNWMTVNEPWVIANLGYLMGEHAPGRSDLRDAIAASHHVLLGHGLAMTAVRAAVPDARVGIVLNFTPVTPIGDSPAALERQQLIDEYDNHWYADPIGGRGYPAFATERLGWDQSEVLSGDMELIAQPIDVLGINYYTRQMVGAFAGEKRDRGAETAMQWEVHPPSLGRLLVDLHERHGFPRIMITENGAAMPDLARTPAPGTDDEGRTIVDDADRIDYLARHLGQVATAIERGVPIDGYFAWSLLDNFEWAFGYGPKFGLVEVDLDTQERRPKASAHWYADVIANNAVEHRDEPTV